MLQTIDLFWIDHLEIMDHLRSSVNLRAYGQRDPLVEYKNEGLILFKNMLVSTDDQIIKLIPNMGMGAFAKEEERLRKNRENIKTISGSDDEPQKGHTVVKTDEEKIGRNDPCYCGSGKKYKKCHGK